jgi:hypothetical protein
MRAVLNTSIKLSLVTHSFLSRASYAILQRLIMRDAAGSISAMAFIQPGMTERNARNLDISSAVSR